MRVLEAGRVAATAIAANRLRSALTILGVVIGVMSVVLLVAVGTGARNEVTAGVEDLGSNLLIVAPGSFEFGQAPSASRFTLEDVERLDRALQGRAAVSGQIVSGETIRAEGVSATSSVLGVTAGYDQALGRVTSRGEFLNASDVATGRRVVVLVASAGISLLVGGIGVSNIMLVSVSERTREIGLRKALGARTRDITLQFLVEAVALCGVGGLLGIGLGVGLAEVATRFSPLPADVTSWSVALAFGTSLTVGVVFGVFPARRAGKLDPVVALRYE